ncbi:hypothetical protein [Lacimicrobium sp. SS2-24]|uniref:hypothetical protein n=1 Tax=Lacimicrobium sp. SS2-24 TaxID=2005569 RepID=UPI000B4B63AD|nr:hypothetical protein [Lacimicrobium sp. SS2-24]
MKQFFSHLCMVIFIVISPTSFADEHCDNAECVDLSRVSDSSKKAGLAFVALVGAAAATAYLIMNDDKTENKEDFLRRMNEYEKGMGMRLTSYDSVLDVRLMARPKSDFESTKYINSLSYIVDRHRYNLIHLNIEF